MLDSSSASCLNGIIVGTLYEIIALGVTLTFGITGIVILHSAPSWRSEPVCWYLTGD